HALPSSRITALAYLPTLSILSSNDTPNPQIYSLSLHDALPISKNIRHIVIIITATWITQNTTIMKWNITGGITIIMLVMPTVVMAGTIITTMEISRNSF